jgi:hypothetical protein
MLRRRGQGRRLMGRRLGAGQGRGQDQGGDHVASTERAARVMSRETTASSKASNATK